MVSVTYWSPIDGHVHLRGDEYADINPSITRQVFRDAKAVGLRALVEEPNAVPYVKDRKSAEKRAVLIDRIREEEDAMGIEHAMAIAVTSNENQIYEALSVIAENPRVPTGKSFLCRTTKSEELEIITQEKQKFSWQVLANVANGDIIREIHPEVQEMFVTPFDPKKPETHAYRQGPEAELVSFERNVRFAYNAGYKGKILVKHATNAALIDFGDDFIRRHPGWKGRLLYETTWHHLWLNIEEDYPIHGNLVKMNPPLRSKEIQEGILNAVIDGRTHTIGTDDARHPIEHKIGEPYKSGIKAIPFYPMGIYLLRKAGLKQEDERRLTFTAPNDIYFQGRLEPREVTVEYNPRLWGESNPFSRVDGTRKAA